MLLLCQFIYYQFFGGLSPNHCVGKIGLQSFFDLAVVFVEIPGSDSHGREEVIAVSLILTKVDFAIMQIREDHNLSGGFMTVVDNQVAELMVLVRIDWSCRFDFSCGIQLKYVFVDVEYLLLALVNAIRVVQQVVPDFDDVVTKVQVAVDKGVIPGPKP